jgi:hypothetical protein
LPKFPPLFDDRSAHIDRFGLLLVVTIGAVAVQALVDTRQSLEGPHTGAGALVLTAFVGAAFLLALRASGVAPVWQRIADALVVVGFLAVVVTVAVDASSTGPSSGLGNASVPLGWSILAVVTPLTVIRRLTRHKRATTQTLFGAISAYLLIALSFNYLFLSIDRLQSTPFFETPEPTTSFMYFSVVTLATLGYGDLSPTTELGRLAAISEAVIGQVFLVTFVAMIVGMLIQARVARGDE